MKILERMVFDQTENKIIHHRKFLNDPYITQAKQLRDAGADHLAANKDCKLVGRIPMHLITEWISEAGLKWSDTQACKELIHKKMLDPEYAHLRVWQGRY